jgi:DHA2 family multidrug resistance protein-like MFS transporter
MSKFQKWTVLGIVSSALFLIVLDMTVLYAALPRLTHDLQATASDKLWIVNAYALVMAGLLLGTGTLGDRIGHKRMFLLGLVVFGVATLIAAFSQSSSMLIFGRVVLAIGAAMMMPATLSLIRVTFTDSNERSMAIGVWASVAAGGAGLGPLIGGLLLEYFWWGSVFLINVPVVVLALVSGWFLIPDSKEENSKPWDLISSVFIMIGLVSLVYAVKEASARNADLTIVLIALVIGVIGLTLFTDRQRRLTYPLVDFSLFKNRLLIGGVLTAVFSAAVNIGFMYALTQRMQLVVGMTPFEAGKFVIATPLASFFAGAFAGWLLPRVGTARMLWGTLVIAAIGMVMFYFSYEDMSRTIQFLSLMVLGLGIGAATTTASSAIMNNAPVERAGMAASVEEVSYEVGGAIGVAILGSALSFLYTRAFQIPESLSHIPQVVRDSLDEAFIVAEGLPPDQADSLVSLGKSAFEQGFVGVMIVSVIILVVMTGIVWNLTRHVTPEQDNFGAH